MTFANITTTPVTDGIAYGTGVVVPFTEGDLADLSTPDPIPVGPGQTVIGIVQLSLNGLVTTNNTFIAMQTDLGDGIWIDVAWIVWQALQGSKTFILCGGGLGAMNNAFSQRQPNALPAPFANGSNAVPLGGRVRFTGRAQFNGGSSSLAGVTTGVIATTKYRVQEPR